MADASVQIRAAVLEDLEQIHEIAVAGWIPIFDLYRLIVGERMWGDVWGGWEANWFPPRAERFNERIIVAELDGDIAGFATWWLPGDGLGEVGGNAVDPALQGRGIGSMQTRWVVDKLREEGCTCAKVHTGMDPAHGPARAEYRKAGLRRAVLNSVYLNYLDEVACVPVPPGLDFRWASTDDRDWLSRTIRAAWMPICEDVCSAVGDDIFDVAFADFLEKKVSDCVGAIEESPERVRIVSEGGESVGFALLRQEPPKKLGEIAVLGVDPRFQGRGIGAALCMDAFDVFRHRELQYVRLRAGLGEVHWKTRQLCWNVGLYRQLPSVDYYAML